MALSIRAVPLTCDDIQTFKSMLIVQRIAADRMAITGARWGLEGAEAILKLRAVLANGDFGRYWPYHLRREHERIHGALPRNPRPRRLIRPLQLTPGEPHPKEKAISR